MNKNICALFIVLILICSTVRAVDETTTEPSPTTEQPTTEAPQYQTDYKAEGFSWTDSTQWTENDWHNVNPNDIPNIPEQYLQIDKLTDTQRVKVTIDQLDYGTNLQKAGDFSDYDQDTVQLAFRQKYNRDMTAGTAGFRVTSQTDTEVICEIIPQPGQAVAPGETRRINLKDPYPQDTKFESVQDGWRITNPNNGGVREITGNVADIIYNTDGSFGIDGNRITFSEKASTYSKDEKGRVSGTNVIVEGTDLRGDDYRLTGRGAIEFTDVGNVKTAEIDPYDGKQSTFTNRGVTITTVGHDLFIVTLEKDYETAIVLGKSVVEISDNYVSGNGAFQLQRGDFTASSKSDKASFTFRDLGDGFSTTTANGIITMRDAASRYSGLQDASVMRKETAFTTAGKQADHYIIDGGQGDIGKVTKNIQVAVGRSLTQTSVTTTVSRDAQGMTFNVDNAKLLQFADKLSQPGATALVQRELYISAGQDKSGNGEAYFGLNDRGMGRFESADGLLSTCVFSPQLVQSADVGLGQHIVAMSDADTAQLQRLVSFNAQQLKTIDVSKLRENPQFADFIGRNLGYNLDVLDHAVKNPDDPASVRYLGLVEQSQELFRQATEQAKSADAEQDKTQKQKLELAALKTQLDAQISFETANGRDAKQFKDARSRIDAAEKLTARFEEIQKLPVQQQVIAWKELRNDPQYAQLAQQALSTTYLEQAAAELQGTNHNKVTLALLNYQFAENNAPPELKAQMHAALSGYEQKILSAIGTNLEVSRDISQIELEQRREVQADQHPYQQLLDPFKSTTGVVLTGERVVFAVEKLVGFEDSLEKIPDENQRNLAKQHDGVRLMSLLRERGYDWSQISAARFDQTGETLANLLSPELKNLNPQTQQQIVKAMSGPREGLELAFQNQDVLKLINPRADQQFGFETGQSYGQTLTPSPTVQTVSLLVDSFTNVPSLLLGATAAKVLPRLLIAGGGLVAAGSAIKIGAEGGAIAKIGDTAFALLAAKPAGAVAGAARTVSSTATAVRDLINTNRLTTSLGFDAAIRFSPAAAQAETELLQAQRALRTATSELGPKIAVKTTTTAEDARLLELKRNVAAAQQKFDSVRRAAQTVTAAKQYAANVERGTAQVERGVSAATEARPAPAIASIAGETGRPAQQALEQIATEALDGTVVVNEGKSIPVNALETEVSITRNAETGQEVMALRNKATGEVTQLGENFQIIRGRDFDKATTNGIKGLFTQEEIAAPQARLAVSNGHTKTAFFGERPIVRVQTRTVKAEEEYSKILEQAGQYAENKPQPIIATDLQKSFSARQIEMGRQRLAAIQAVREDMNFIDGLVKEIQASGAPASPIEIQGLQTKFASLEQKLTNLQGIAGTSAKGGLEIPVARQRITEALIEAKGQPRTLYTVSMKGGGKPGKIGLKDLNGQLEDLGNQLIEIQNNALKSFAAENNLIIGTDYKTAILSGDVESSKVAQVIEATEREMNIRFLEQLKVKDPGRFDFFVGGKIETPIEQLVAEGVHPIELRAGSASTAASTSANLDVKVLEAQYNAGLAARAGEEGLVAGRLPAYDASLETRIKGLSIGEQARYNDFYLGTDVSEDIPAFYAKLSTEVEQQIARLKTLEGTVSPQTLDDVVAELENVKTTEAKLERSVKYTTRDVKILSEDVFRKNLVDKIHQGDTVVFTDAVGFGDLQKANIRTLTEQYARGELKKEAFITKLGREPDGILADRNERMIEVVERNIDEANLPMSLKDELRNELRARGGDEGKFVIRKEIMDANPNILQEIDQALEGKVRIGAAVHKGGNTVEEAITTLNKANEALKYSKNHGNVPALFTDADTIQQLGRPGLEVIPDARNIPQLFAGESPVLRNPNAIHEYIPDLQPGDTIHTRSGSRFIVESVEGDSLRVKHIDIEGVSTTEAISKNSLRNNPRIIEAIERAPPQIKDITDVQEISNFIPTLKEGDVILSKSGTIRIVRSTDGNSMLVTRIDGQGKTAIEKLDKRTLANQPGVIESIQPGGAFRYEQMTVAVPKEISSTAQYIINNYGGSGTSVEELAKVYGYRPRADQLWFYNDFAATQLGGVPVEIQPGTIAQYSLHISSTEKDFDTVVKEMGKFLYDEKIGAAVAPGKNILNPVAAGENRYGKVFLVYPKTRDEMIKVIEKAGQIHKDLGVGGISVADAEHAGAGLQYEFSVPETGNIIYYTIDKINGNYIGGVRSADRLKYMQQYFGKGPIDDYIGTLRAAEIAAERAGQPVAVAAAP